MKQGLAPFTPRIDPALQCRWERCASFCFVERDSDSRGNLLVLNGVPGGLCPAPWADRPRLPICLNHAPKVVGAMGGVDGFRGTSGKNLQSVGCCKKERKNNEKKPARAVLPGSPRGPGEPCHPAGVPAHNPVKLTTRLSSRTRVPTIKPPPSEPLPRAAGAQRPGTWCYESSFLAKHCGRFGELPTPKWGNLRGLQSTSCSQSKV